MNTDDDTLAANVTASAEEPTPTGLATIQITDDVASLNAHVDSNNVATNDSTTIEEDLGSGVHFRKQKRPPSALNDRPAMARHSSHGGISHHSESSHLIPVASTKEEKLKQTKQYFSTVFGIMYSLFLITFALVAYIGNAVVDQYPLTQAYSITMIGIAFLYFIFMMVDIRRHVSKVKNTMKERERRKMLVEAHAGQQADFIGGPMELKVSRSIVQIADYNLPPLKPVEHRYCFMTGRHGEFFYLKLGAAWFCFGLLIHSALQVTYQISFLTSTDPKFAECASGISLAFEILFPIYSVFILFFIFKYINIIINVYREFSRLLLMHAIGTSLALWVRTIVQETVDAINLADYYDYDEPPYYVTSMKNHSVSGHARETEDDDGVFVCPGPEALNTIYMNFSPYLYPFIIEFCIYIVGIWYMIWANISHCPKKLSAKGHGHEEVLHHGNINDQGHSNGPMHTIQENDEDENRFATNRPESVHSTHCDNLVEHEDSYKTSYIITADCHASFRGLFAGLILLVATIVVIIIFHVAVNDEDYFEIGRILNDIFYLIVLCIMIICTCIGYFMTSKLDVNTHPISKLDDVLLFIAIPAFFLETTFSMVPAIYNGTGLNVAIIMTQLVQILIQTPWIIDAIRRCANCSAAKRHKPGREMVSFMIVANVSLWVYLTFSVKIGYTGDERYDFYGYTLWSILNHISLPLIMFYRFHSSVCLVDIWRHSYEPSGH